MFVENASKDNYVTNEIMKRWYLFEIVLLFVGYVCCDTKTSIFLSIFCCLHVDFTVYFKRMTKKHRSYLVL